MIHLELKQKCSDEEIKRLINCAKYIVLGHFKFIYFQVQVQELFDNGLIPNLYISDIKLIYDEVYKYYSNIK